MLVDMLQAGIARSSTSAGGGAAGANDRIEFVTIPQSRLFVMDDQPNALDRALDRFLQRKAGQ